MAKKIPLRQCVGCGEMKSKKEMMRVVRAAEDDGICLDMTGKRNGRGAYVCKSGECLRKAQKNKGLERSFKMSIPSEVYDTLKKEFDEFETK